MAIVLGHQALARVDEVGYRLLQGVNDGVGGHLPPTPPHAHPVIERHPNVHRHRWVIHVSPPSFDDELLQFLQSGDDVHRVCGRGDLLTRTVVRSLLDVCPSLFVDHHLEGLRAPFCIDSPQGPIQDQEALVLNHHVANRCPTNGAPFLLLDDPGQPSRRVVWVLLCLYQRIDGFGARKASSNQASCLGTHESIQLQPCRIPFSNIGKNDLLCAGLLLEMYQRRSQASQHTLPICRVLPICETRPKYSLYDWVPCVGVYVELHAALRVIPPSNEVYVSSPAVGLMIVHLSSSPPEFMRNIESMILLSILTASLAYDPPLEAPCWGTGPPEVCFLCPELDSAAVPSSMNPPRRLLSDREVLGAPLQFLVGFVDGAAGVLVEVNHVVLLRLLFNLLQPAYPLAPILVLSGPVCRVWRQADGVDVHRRQR